MFSTAPTAQAIPARPTSYASALATYQATGVQAGLIVNRRDSERPNTRRLFVPPPARGVRSY